RGRRARTTGGGAAAGADTFLRRARRGLGTGGGTALLRRRSLSRAIRRHLRRLIPAVTLGPMRERDLFANFDRVRLEVDELFRDVLQRSGLSRRQGGFCPAVDVAYTAEPPLAVVTAELAGVAVEDLELEIQGRQLILSGRR